MSWIKVRNLNLSSCGWYSLHLQLNVLYWHVADSQSFPLDVAAFPELAEKGAYSDTERYSISDVQHIVSYANQRGIDVIMVRFISNRPMHHTKYLYIRRNSIALDTRQESPLRIPNTSLVQTSRRGLSTRTNRPPDSFA